MKSDRPLGDVAFIGLPIRDLSEHGGKVEQFADIIMNEPLDVDQNYLDNTLYRLCAQSKYQELPLPFLLRSDSKTPKTKNTH